jgi:hypothetical protein
MTADPNGLPLPGPAANEPGAPRLTLPGKQLRAGAGVDWVSDGWTLLRKSMLMWVIFLVLFCLVHIGLAMIPWIGGLLGTLVSPILFGGFALGCRALETGGELDLDHFLAGFRRNTGMLFAIGVIYVVGEIALLGVFAFFVGWSLVWAALAGGGNLLTAVAGSTLGVAMGALVVLALAVPLMAAVWFAPAFAMLHDMPALPAVKASLVGCLRNWLPFFIYGLVMLALAVVAVIPFGLGLLLWIPLMFTSWYTSYRAIFTEPDDAAP